MIQLQTHIDITRLASTSIAGPFRLASRAQSCRVVATRTKVHVHVLYYMKSMYMRVLPFGVFTHMYILKRQKRIIPSIVNQLVNVG